MEDQSSAASNRVSDVGGAIIVFSKCPIKGKSKTRLTPLLGSDGAALLAKAMLSDIICSLSECTLLNNTLKVLVYAPGTSEGESIMVSILQSLDINYHTMDAGIINCPSPEEVQHGAWVLMPMKPSDLTSSSLGDKLEDALIRTRKLISDIPDQKNEACLFLGMDSPELHIEEIVYGLQQSSREVGKAHCCPAQDGGYGLLSIPKQATATAIFTGVRWSDQQTAVSQMKALSDNHVDVTIGKLMYDVDEPDDVKDLAKRLSDGCYMPNESLEQSDDVLTNFASGISNTHSTNISRFPHYTFQQLKDLNCIQERDKEDPKSIDRGQLGTK